jgi:hypothetical protein
MIQDRSSALVRRLERGALIWCGLAVVVAAVVAPSRTDVMLGILGGGLMALASFYAIRGSIDALFVRIPPPAAADGTEAAPARRPSLAGAATKVAGRYALLALLAYVMIARLRLHPVGLLVGMTALAASATAEAVRSLGRPGSSS